MTVYQYQCDCGYTYESVLPLAECTHRHTGGRTIRMRPVADDTPPHGIPRPGPGQTTLFDGDAA